jgi:hypothetical protein
VTIPGLLMLVAILVLAAALTVVSAWGVNPYLRRLERWIEDRLFPPSEQVIGAYARAGAGSKDARVVEVTRVSGEIAHRVDCVGCGVSKRCSDRDAAWIVAEIHECEGERVS